MFFLLAWGLLSFLIFHSTHVIPFYFISLFIIFIYFKHSLGAILCAALLYLDPGDKPGNKKNEILPHGVDILVDETHS